MRSDNMMTHKGYHARIMEAQRLKGDSVFGLPSGSPLAVYPADAFVNYPENWMKGPGVFVVPVHPDKGLWFDWTANDAENTAVLPTVKGCNPITGMATSGFRLERYDNKCPKHGTEFKGDRYCPDCDYKWPAQNYISSPNTLWLDGFFNVKDGTVRQFFFTEEELRDVATHMIGKENTVSAFGFAFYKPKNPRPPMVSIYRGAFTGAQGISPNLLGGYGDVYYKDMPKIYNSTLSWDVKTSSKTFTSGILGSALLQDSECLLNASNSGDGSAAVYMCAASAAAESPIPMAAGASDEVFTMDSMRERSLSRSMKKMRCVETPVKEVSVGAGAKINQDIIVDPYALDTWCDTPESVMTVYFVFHDKFDEMKSGGMRNLDGKPEGMLAGLPIG